MAKKAEKKTPKPHSRMQDITPADLKDYAKQVAHEAEMLVATAKAMENSGYSQMTIDGRAKITRALELLRDYNLNADVAFRRAKIRDGK